MVSPRVVVKDGMSGAAVGRIALPELCHCRTFAWTLRAGGHECRSDMRQLRHRRRGRPDESLRGIYGGNIPVRSLRQHCHAIGSHPGRNLARHARLSPSVRPDRAVTKVRNLPEARVGWDRPAHPPLG